MDFQLRDICLSAWNVSAPTGRIFMKFYLKILPKYVEKLQVSLKCDNYKKHFSWRRTYIYDNISQNSS